MVAQTIPPAALKAKNRHGASPFAAASSAAGRVKDWSKSAPGSNLPT